MLLLAGLLSCSEKEESPVIPVLAKPDCLPTRITVGSNHNTFAYDLDRRLVKSYDGLTVYIKYAYSGDRLIKLIYYHDNDESKVIDTDEIQYNAMGLWTKHVRTMSGEEDIAEYDSNGNRIKITSTKNGKAYQTYWFDYDNGNLVKQSRTRYDKDGSVSSALFYSYEYDLSKANKLAHFELFFQRGYGRTSRLGGESTPPKNLMTKVHTHSSDGGPVLTTADFEYAFNEKGFPTTITVSGGDLNQDGITDESDVVYYVNVYDCL